MAAKTPNAEELLVKLAAADNVVATKRGALKQAEQEYEAIADQLFALMDEQGTEQLRSTKAGLLVTISEAIIPQVTDWAALGMFILRNKKLELFQRRLSPAVWADLIEARRGKEIPGVVPFKKRRLHVTKSK